MQRVAAIIDRSSNKMNHNYSPLKNLSELEKLHWNVEIVVITVLYGNQDIHIKSVEALAKATSSDKRLNMIIVDNKGDYDINALMESKEVIDKPLEHSL